MFLDILARNLHASISRYPDVLKYLHSRYVTDDDIREYELGFNKIIGVPKEDSTDYKRFMDECWKGRKLENKIIFPLKDRLGRVEGLMGRSVDTKEFKIFATEEAKYTGFFFGLWQALPFIYKEKKVFLVEGPFDLYAFRKIKLNTIATLTSGISENQYKLIKRYCDTIVTVFDSDIPGKRGTREAKEYRNVKSIDLKFKDPAKALEILGQNKFIEYITRTYGWITNLS